MSPDRTTINPPPDPAQACSPGIESALPPGFASLATAARLAALTPDA